MDKMCNTFENAPDGIIIKDGAIYSARKNRFSEDTVPIKIACPTCGRKIGARVFERVSLPHYQIPPHKKKAWWKKPKEKS